MSIKEVGRWFWFVDMLPRKLLYFCFLKVMAHATTGQYGETVVPELTGMDAIKRYGEDFGI